VILIPPLVPNTNLTKKMTMAQTHNLVLYNFHCIVRPFRG
jgi:hypothetical protein